MKNKPRPKPVAKPVKQVPPKVPALFRKSDWLSCLVTFVVMWVIYGLTLAPEVTLEDAGELITGAVYAGIPHPPGYPVWTLYSWLWTVLVPVGNMAWRVALAQANAGAVACALIALIVSRGSSLLIESMESLSGLAGGATCNSTTASLPLTEPRFLYFFPARLTGTVICTIAGVVAGLLMGLDAFMWRESVTPNRMAVASVPWFMLVLVCLLRWLYARHQLRFLYWALFLFGLCFTTHQSLIVAAIGIEVLIAAANPRLGREVFLGNAIIYLFYEFVLLSTGQHLFHNLGAKPGLLLLFNVIGVGSLIASGWLAIRTKGLLSEWKPVIIMGLLWILGASFYFYLPLSGMTNPPMQWCYPRTVDGFIHALTRGQYEQPNPINVFHEPGRFIGQLGMLISGIADSFTWVAMLLALVPFLFLLKLRQRERAWLIGLAALYLCLGVLLMILLNPTPERASADLVKVFFNNSHTLIAALIGYGLALTAAYMATNYERFRGWGMLAGLIAVTLALYSLVDSTRRHYFGPAGQVALTDLPHWIARAFAKNQYGLPILANLLLVSLALGFFSAMVFCRRRAPLVVALAVFAAPPFYSGLSHWFECDQRGHMFGYWFGHDMFTPPFKGSDSKPLFPPMTRDAILFGGTDPGRFCPTYMIFCESFTRHRCQPAEDQNFDRRDVCIITQNALADPPYLNYIRAHYNRSAQIDPPFFSELFRTVGKDKEYETNLLARAAVPLDSVMSGLGGRIEKRRRTYTSWFTDKDFIDLPAFTARLQPDTQQDPLSKYLYENLSGRTQKLVCAKQEGKLLRCCLAKDLNGVLEREISSDRIKHVALSDSLTDFIRENPQGHTRIRLNRLLLEAAYPGALAQSLGGLYPDREIYTPSLEDQQHAFQEYMADVQRRMALNQLKPGEDVKIIDNRIQISGTTAVMAINGLLTKAIFERNPKREFFVEESFPLDWMYPYLTPHGVIMKLNRAPLASLSDELLQKDHEFWRQYSERFTGDIIRFDTSVKDVSHWIEKTYLRYDFNGFIGQRKFIHDIDAQKSFSKLRTAIAGIYAWRLSPQCPAEYRPKTQAEFQGLLREANFAFLQAYAFCPWSPEAVMRYAGLLLQSSRLDDALLIAETSLKFDPYNGQILGLANNLRQWKKSIVTSVPPR
jgi:hypothetical protein